MTLAKSTLALCLGVAWASGFVSAALFCVTVMPHARADRLLVSLGPAVSHPLKPGRADQRRFPCGGA